jgi:DNA polymerase-4
MARDNADWLAKKGLFARTVTIKVRYSDFTTITRSDSRAPTNDADEIVQRAVLLLGKTDAGRRPVRLLGAGLHNFTDGSSAPDGRLPFEETRDG